MIPRSAVNDEVLMDDKSNDGDDYVVFQDATRSNELCLVILQGEKKMKSFDRG